jgi:hypothetical protein
MSPLFQVGHGETVAKRMGGQPDAGEAFPPCRVAQPIQKLVQAARRERATDALKTYGESVAGRSRWMYLCSSARAFLPTLTSRQRLPLPHTFSQAPSRSHVGYARRRRTLCSLDA